MGTLSARGLVTGYLYLRSGDWFRQASELLQRRYSADIVPIHPSINLPRHIIAACRVRIHAIAVGTTVKTRSPMVSRDNPENLSLLERSAA
jgi:hypothetical protein